MAHAPGAVHQRSRASRFAEPLVLRTKDQKHVPGAAHQRSRASRWQASAWHLPVPEDQGHTWCPGRPYRARSTARTSRCCSCAADPGQKQIQGNSKSWTARATATSRAKADPVRGCGRATARIPAERENQQQQRWQASSRTRKATAKATTTAAEAAEAAEAARGNATFLDTRFCVKQPRGSRAFGAKWRSYCGLSVGRIMDFWTHL